MLRSFFRLTRNFFVVLDHRVKARGALAVLSMVASAKASFCLGPLGLTILQKVTALPKEGGVGDFRLMKHACTTLRKMAVGKVQDTAAVALELGASKKSSIASLCSAIRVKGSKAAAVSKIVANLVEAMSGYVHTHMHHINCSHGCVCVMSQFHDWLTCCVTCLYQVSTMPLFRSVAVTHTMLHELGVVCLCALTAAWMEV